MNPIQIFEQEREQRIATLANDVEFKEQSRAWVEQSMR